MSIEKDLRKRTIRGKFGEMDFKIIVNPQDGTVEWQTRFDETKLDNMSLAERIDCFLSDGLIGV